MPDAPQLITLLLALVTALIVLYTITMFIAGSRRDDPEDQAADDGDHLRFVLLIPCLNEAVVIGRTIERLIQAGDERLHVVVIDDGSTDDTAQIVRAFGSPRVELFQRHAPNARQGKGEALNDAYRYLRNRFADEGVCPDDVIVGVLDADGRLGPDTAGDLALHFGDPLLGAMQIRVLIHNQSDGLLPRLQDVEFATFTEVFQRARAKIGSSGLGGNGQFVRLSALMTLGDSPWSDCLTEDLELGINLLLRDWTNGYSEKSWVSQQGITDVRRLVRQRARWFQGHLQCLKLVRPVIGSSLPRRARFDLTYHLVGSMLMLVLQTAALVWMIGLAVAFGQTRGLAGTVFASPTKVVTLYLLAFGMSPLVAVAYRRARQDVPLWRCLALAHGYVIYTYVWWLAGLSAAANHLLGRRSWAKTERTLGTGDEAVIDLRSNTGSPGATAPTLIDDAEVVIDLRSNDGSRNEPEPTLNTAVALVADLEVADGDPVADLSEHRRSASSITMSGQAPTANTQSVHPRPAISLWRCLLMANGYMLFTLLWLVAGRSPVACRLLTRWSRSRVDRGVATQDTAVVDLRTSASTREHTEGRPVPRPSDPAFLRPIHAHPKGALT
jgi:1,2-diacylglycerol 3-beta-glucosyltransferase